MVQGGMWGVQPRPLRAQQPLSWGHGSAAVPAVGRRSWACLARAVLSSHLAKQGQHPFSQLGSRRLGLGSRLGEEGQRGRATAPLQAAWALLTPGWATAPLPHPCGPLSHARNGRRLPTSGPCQRLPVSCLKPSVSQGPQLSLCTRSCPDHSGPPPLSPAPSLAPRCWGYSCGESQEELAPRTPAEGYPEAPSGGWRCWLGLSCGQQALVVPVGRAGPEGGRRGAARGRQELGTPSLLLSWFPWPPKGLLIPGWARAPCLSPSPLPYLSEIPGDPQADPSRAPVSPLRGAPGACPFSLQSARQLPTTSAPSLRPSWASFPNAGPTPPVLPWAHLTPAPRDKGTAPQTAHSHPRPGHSALLPTPSLLFTQPLRSDSQTPAHPPDSSSRSPAECP